jgi:hypothetical protein
LEFADLLQICEFIADLRIYCEFADLLRICGFIADLRIIAICGIADVWASEIRKSAILRIRN